MPLPLWLLSFVQAMAAIVIMARSNAATDPSLYSETAPLRVEALRQGGFVIFIRHTTADQGFDDPAFDLASCATQRNLGERGRQDAALIGRGIREAGIPVGAVFSSEYCRAVETARLAFGGAEPATGLNSCCIDGRALTNPEREAFLKRALGRRPKPGTNTVLVGHLGHMIADLAMGEASVYAPDGTGGFTRVARILPSEWTNGVYRPSGATSAPMPNP
jgi:phosphohistidine phosphatase SixA